MNEVSKIHLGRQAFTISVEAHKALKNYLEAITKQVDEKDVVDEVELRMAELLSEHGISGDKVILPADVDFLKAQLGNPKDFTEDSETSTALPVDKPTDTKRLFRDTDCAMIAGVAAGLSKYFGVDVLLIRVLFMIGIFTGGWGILLYLMLWLLVPEAKTSSDRLQMAGQPITVDSLKEAVNRADVRGAAHRVNNTIAGPINSFFKFVLKFCGVLSILAGLAMIFGLVAAASYLALHSNTLPQDNVFPIGSREHLLLYVAMSVAAIIAIFIVLFGMAMFRRKWPIHTWITGMLIGLVFIGMASGGALAADAYPHIRDRYNANTHTTTRNVLSYEKINVTGEDVPVLYQFSDKYAVSFNYFGNPDLSNIKTTVDNGTLTIDTRRFDEQRKCQTLCVPPTYNLTITIYSPNPPAIPDTPPAPDIPARPSIPGSRLY